MRTLQTLYCLFLKSQQCWHKRQRKFDLIFFNLGLTTLNNDLKEIEKSMYFLKLHRKKTNKDNNIKILTLKLFMLLTIYQVRWASFRVIRTLDWILLRGQVSKIKCSCGEWSCFFLTRVLHVLCCPCSLLSVLPRGVRHLRILRQEVHEHLDLVLRRFAHLLCHTQLPHR